MGKSPRTSQGRSIARRMESSGGRRKQKGDGLVPRSKHAGLFSDDAIASFDELLNSDDVAFRTAPGPPVRRAPPPEPDSAAAAAGAAGTPSWIPSALRTASSGRWLSWINVAMLLVLLLGAGLAYVYVGGSEWTEPAEADMRVADTAGMVELAPAASEPPSAKDIVEEYRRKRLAKEAKEREEREERLAARLAEVANEATTSPAPEPAPPAPSLEPEPPPPPPPRRAMKPKDRVMKRKSTSTQSSRPTSTSTESSRPTSKSAGSETDEERAARYAREDAAREARIRREDEERAARIEEEERAAKARVEELEARARVEELETSRGGAGEAGKPAAVVDAVDYDEEEDRPAPVQQRKEERKKEREEAPAVAGNLGVDYE